MRRTQPLVCLLLVLTVIVQVTSGQDSKKSPKLSPRRANVPTHWVAAEAIPGPNVDFAISIDKHLAVVAFKLQVAEGDESYSDPLRKPWVDCTGAAAPGLADSVTCGANVPMIFTQFYDNESRDGLYRVFQIQARNGSPVRFRARYALEVQATEAK
jgi:hypothetical protein